MVADSTTPDSAAGPAEADRPRPQDDLFRAVNGEWLATAEIPEDQSTYGAFMELRDASEAACRAIVERAAAEPGAPGTPGQLIGDLYTSFMDTDLVEARGVAPLQDALHRIGGAIDLVGFFQVLGRFGREGVGGPVGFYVGPDADDPDHYLPHLYQSGIGLPDESYYRDEAFAAIRDAYTPHVTRMLELAGVDEAPLVASAAVGLETELAAAHWDRVSSRDRTRTHNPTERAELDSLVPAVLWDAWLDGLQAPAALLERVDLMQPSFLAALGDLLTEDRLPDWRAWLTWRVVRAWAPYGPDVLVRANFDFYGRVLSGTPVLRERWKRGVSLVEGAVGEALGELYVREHFTPESKARMDELVGHLLAAYRDSIGRLSWMTDETRDRALDKLSQFRPKIGYPVRFRDYAGLVVDRTDLLGNVRRAEAVELDHELAKIGGPVDRDEWLMTPQTVNAYYHPGMNEIVFPAAILQPPFFDPAADDATNFGGIGAVIGHEIGHGFDDQGSKYDGRGGLRDWWTGDDRAAFEGLTGRLVAQYSALSPEGADGRFVNGELTIGENIGDLGGLGIAVQAWRRTPAGRDAGDDAVRELFLNWARVWRAKTRPAEVQRRLAVDPHSPPEFRCNQTVRNLDEFHRAFGTAPGDALWLDEGDRVQIW
ncbi:M13 family metallopeptidase [Nakamurella endophytica]|uniref:Zinc metalloprotease n=1 Tax=Nakamurella endophytica TaxID=1748367 RepID=A0A917WFV7_9ACTN|nr:M13-type metalloendopeptidase [Nakamurella endophytica]GGM00320.1 putative zinc metalloprotease [Nakamurella endophytica]